MPKFTVERSHQLSIEEIRKRLQGLADRLGSKYGLTATWTSPNQAEVKRTGATGTIQCGPDKVSVSVDLSFALSPIKGKVEQRVQAELEQMLA